MISSVIHQIMKIQYCYKMLKRPTNRLDVDLVEISIEQVPANILEIIKTNESFSKSCTFGKKGIGKPEEYEKLVISDGKNEKQFEYFNKGLHFMMSGGEKEKPVFQVFAYFMAHRKKNG